MEYTYSKIEIIYPNKELTIIDKLVFDFVSRINVKYVIVSGYVAILFGRNRNTEDIDLFIEELDFKDFSRFYDNIISSKKYYCINAEDAREAYHILTIDKSSIRFAEPDTFDPNFEIKFPQNELNHHSLQKAVTVKVNKKYEIKIGPMELQLAYKLKLGSEKDLLDASHLYEIFRNDIDKQELKLFVKKLNISESTAKKIFGDDYGKKGQ